MKARMYAVICDGSLSVVVHVIEMVSQRFFENAFPYIAEMFSDPFMKGAFSFSHILFAKNVALKAVY